MVSTKTEQMTGPGDIDLFELRLTRSKKWGQGVTGDILLFVDGERIAEDYFPGNMGFELTHTLLSLFISTENLHAGEKGLAYNFACGGCKEDGCTQIRWEMEREGDFVAIDMRGYKEKLSDGSYVLRFTAFVLAIESLFESFIDEMDRNGVERFDFDHMGYYGVETLSDFREKRDQLGAMRSN